MKGAMPKEMAGANFYLSHKRYLNFKKPTEEPSGNLK